MGLNQQIAHYRKAKNITQDELAKQLGISNQAVSKWETNQSYPDIELLPKIADFFEITLDELFERKNISSNNSSSFTESEPNVSCETSSTDNISTAPSNTIELPWVDDETLHAVLFIGHKIIQKEALKENLTQAGQHITIHYDGTPLNIDSYFNVSCEKVNGNVTAGGYIECADIEGTVTASSHVECNNITGNVTAGSYVECDDVTGNITADSYVECNDVTGNITADSYVECNDVTGNITADGNIECEDVIHGNVFAKGNIECGIVNGDVKANGNVDVIR